ncbi:MAG TPA: hypothetical protein K8V16_07425 [Rubneribacter badeniensis]|uniref:Uncharacterized protein n=1 Tax=Rubneribacter badeniensis TaxID=2070688 RepID=A0A9D2VKG1_9ACTN|nr:hypothetical protein [Rubneribacter badeniensis]
MEHACKVTVLEKRLFPELQAEYLADPQSGACSCFEVGQEFLFERNEKRDDFWHFRE